MTHLSFFQIFNSCKMNLQIFYLRCACQYLQLPYHTIKTQCLTKRRFIKSFFHNKLKKIVPKKSKVRQTNRQSVPDDSVVIRFEMIKSRTKGEACNACVEQCPSPNLTFQTALQRIKMLTLIN